MDPRVQRLLDEDDIKKLVIRFSLGLDLRDVAMFRGSWADEVDLDLPPLGGSAVKLSGRRRADDYASDAVALMSQFAVTQHVSTNHLVGVDADEGSLTCYTVAQHGMSRGSEMSWLSVGARYDLAARRLEGRGWRLERFRLTALWARGDQGLWGEAVRRLVGGRS